MLRFLFILTSAAVVFATTELILGWRLGSPVLRESSGALWAFVFVISIALRWTLKGRIDTAALWVGGAILVFSIANSLVVPFGTRAMVLVPILAVSSVLPYLRERRLVLFIAVALTVQIFTATLSYLVPDGSVVPPTLKAALVISAVATTSGLILLLLYQFVVRLRQSLDNALIANKRLAFLAETGKILASSANYDETIQEVAKSVVPELGDNCVVDLVEEDGTVRRVAEAANDPMRETLLRQLRKYPSVRGVHSPVAEALRTFQPQTLGALDADALQKIAAHDEYFRIITEIAPKTSVTVPMVARGKALGAITFGRSTVDRPYTSEEIALAKEVAARAAIALENSRLLRDTQQALRAREEFLSIAGHELKTPLAALQLQVQSIFRHPTLSPVDLASRLNKIVRNTKRLDALIEQLLDVTKIAGGKLELELEDVEMETLLTEVVERFSDEAARHSTPIFLSHATPIRGKWDRSRLDQVVTNLLSNAIKYGKGKPVQIRCESGQSMARIEVVDQGIGIATSDQARIFGRFERAVSERHYGGLGLGLWISQQIVQAMNGRIYFRSEPNVGSTFVVELPLSEPVRSPSP